MFRLGADPVSGTLKEASLDLRLRVASPRTVAVDLKPAFNMGFRDEKLNDGKGGWTDQGPSNDLSMMKPGKLAALGVEFDIADPARNDGRSCLVLSSGQKKFPAEKTVNCAKTAGELRYLYLLHASANGALAWTGENKESYVGLYLSCFPVGGTPRKLTFRAAPGGDAVWMILGATLGDRRLNLNQIEPPSYIVAGNDWLPLDYDGTTAKGSPLDFSVFLDAPAGKYGPVTVNGNGHFSFRDAPEKRAADPALRGEICRIPDSEGAGHPGKPRLARRAFHRIPE